MCIRSSNNTNMCLKIEYKLNNNYIPIINMYNKIYTILFNTMSIIIINNV